MAVLNKHRLPGKAVPAGAVYIGRGSPWGNPFVIGKDGNREEVVAKYKSALWERIKDQRVSLQDLAALDGKDLVCFCAPAKCHGDVLENAAAWAAKQIGV